MKLRTKLMIVFLSLSMIPFAVAGYVAYRHTTRTVTQAISTHLNATTAHKEAELKRWVTDSERSLRVLAKHALTWEYVSGLTDELSGTELQRVRARIITDHFNATLAEEGRWLELSLLHDDGTIVMSTDTGQIGQSAAYLTKRAAQPSGPKVLYSDTRQETVMMFTAPVTDKNGELLAVLAGRANLTEIAKILLNTGKSLASEETYAINKSRFLIAASRMKSALIVQSPLYTGGVSACLQKNTGVDAYKGYHGVPVIGGYRWIPEQELCILTEVDQAEAFAPVIVLRNTLFVIATAVAVIATGLAVFFTRAVTARVRQFTKGADENGADQ